MYRLSLDQLRQAEGGFEVAHTTEQSQLATMTLPPGQDSGEYGNEHPQSDQIMIVIEGQAEATVGGQELKVGVGGTLHIKAGEDHQIRNRGDAVLRTVNIYAPPAYDSNGEPL